MPEIQAGRMSVHATLRRAEGRAKPTSWDRLVVAWNNATEDDRRRLALKILLAAERGRQP